MKRSSEATHPTHPAAQARLARFQRDFGALLRTPLDASSGTLRAQTERYDPQLIAAVQDAASCSARERLAVYNRQYWFRLFTTMQTSWPLTARLLGLFFFNLHAQRFLTQTPPRHYDLRLVTLGFDRYLANSIHSDLVDVGPGDKPLPRRALLEAAALDAAFARVFHAPPAAPFDPAQAGSADLSARKLARSAAYARVQEHWPLAELRYAVLESRAERAIALPAAHACSQAQHWALFRSDKGVVQLRLAPLQRRLLELLDSYPLGQALAQLEAEADAEARATLPEQTRGWIAQGVACGFWTGFVD